MSPFQGCVSDWLVARIKVAAQTDGHEIEALNFRTPLYIPQAEYDDGMVNGYIQSDGTPTEKFRIEYSCAVTRFGLIK